MSLYRNHAAAGVTAYGAFYVAAFAVEAVLRFRFGYRLPHQIITTDLAALLGCFFVAFFSSIFPDVDTKSRAQVMFYRIFLIVDGALILRRKFELAAILGLFAVTPLLGGHRGWTHSRIAMFLIPTTFIFIPSLIEGDLILTGLPFSIASFIGYATHLHLDGKLFSFGVRT
jgi:hypothetical protein